VGYGIAFAPLVSAPVLWACAAACVVLAALLALGRTRGALLRVVALALVTLALANPSFTREDREPLTSVAVVVVDKSPSQNFGDRTAQTQTARAALTERLGKIPGLEVRTVEAGQADGDTDGTRLFGALNDVERRLMEQHPVYAKQMLAQIDFLQPCVAVAYSHHERWDGLGYPEGLKGEEIPLPARIFAVVDQWDALTSDRPYRKAWTRESVIAYFRENSGKIYDPEIVDVFLKVI